MVPNSQGSFSILSWNVHGLNSKFKRALLFQYLKTHSPEVVVLQESLPCVVDAVHTDTQGKFVIMVITVWQQTYVLVGVYMPPPTV